MTPKKSPRYLPTLTHIVNEEGLSQVETGLQPNDKEKLSDFQRKIVEEAVNLSMAKLRLRLDGVLQESIHEILRQLEGSVQADVEVLVQRAMSQNDVSEIS